MAKGFDCPGFPVTRRAGMFIVPMDHSVTIGPLGDAQHADTTVRTLADAGADAVVLHRGRVRHVSPRTFAKLGLIVHLSAGTTRSMDLYSKVLVGTVEDAARYGADAVSIHVNIGAPTENEQLKDFGAVSRECEILGIPLLAMMYARGPQRGATAPDATELSHLASIATDLGADIVKLDYSGSEESMRKVVDSCPIPIIVAGGEPMGGDHRAVALGTEIMGSGVAGLSFGRNVFAADNPFAVTAALSSLVHRPAVMESAPERHTRAAALESV
ncbi:2-amino-4,5-dihydroxy-6-oxo-7-(phosphonooxy)heptanoate synthase [Rhodococcus sp. 27YEA15]|uniref:2-amino-3,7-dideoxy-D-threo-hept-6-ulosonate synthase n=1 Tax=Rhodococcus sp. 27YEA15 TaxID=3156259 RepID=UPI003C7AADED